MGEDLERLQAENAKLKSELSMAGNWGTIAALRLEIELLEAQLTTLEDLFDPLREVEDAVKLMRRRVSQSKNNPYLGRQR